MLYPTLNQPLMLLVIFVIGLVGGIMFDFFNFLTFLLFNDKIVKHFFSFLATIFSFCLLFLLNLHFNFGQFRMYVLLVFIAGFFVERIFSKFLWTKLVKKWYSKIAKRKEERSEKGKND